MLPVIKTYHNPILTGCYPDPSICRLGEDYYLVTSSFEYFPGLPIFHSRDLVHWQQIGHALTRPTQLVLDGVPSSEGLYAPTIRYSDGVFYIINTLEHGVGKSGNFIIKASDPAGPWSEPYWLEDAAGIDPSLFFDEDGKAWYVGTRLVTPGQYKGQTEIWLQALNLHTMTLIGEQKVLWNGAVKGAVWAEAPHLYKINGLYYLMIAEGGTGHEHAITVARSEKIDGPYLGNPRNPILTHRHLGLNYPIVGTGHGDLIETQKGEWWMVLLAMRPYGGYYYNLGRETFLAPVIWEDDWPVVSPGSGRVEFSYRRPDLPDFRFPTVPACDHFESKILGLQWNFLRTPHEAFWSLEEKPGSLRLHLRPQKLSEPVNCSFVGRRQQHIHFSVAAALDFMPENPQENAGLVLYQSNHYHILFIIAQHGNENVVRLVKREKDEESLLVEQNIQPSRVYFKIEGHEQNYFFYIATEENKWQLIAENVDGRILSTPVAGGFLGAYIGLYASSNGQPSCNFADFDWFEYTGLDDTNSGF